MVLRNPSDFPQNPDVVLERWYQLGDVQQAVLSLFTTGSAWVSGLLDWRGFAITNLPLVGKAVYAIMRKGSYRPQDEIKHEAAL